MWVEEMSLSYFLPIDSKTGFPEVTAILGRVGDLPAYSEPVVSHARNIFPERLFPSALTAVVSAMLQAAANRSDHPYLGGLTGYLFT